MGRPNLKKQAAQAQIDEMKEAGMEMPAIRKALEELNTLTKEQIDDLFGIIEPVIETEEAQKPKVNMAVLKEQLQDIAHGIEYEWKRLATVDRPDEKTARQQIIAMHRKLVVICNAL